MDLTNRDLPTTSFDLSTCTLVLHATGLVQITFKSHSNYKLADAIEVFELLKKHFKGNKFFILADVNELREANAEVRQYHLKQEQQKIVVATALVIKQPITRVLAQVFIKLNWHTTPLSVFANGEEALEWLNAMYSQNKDSLVTETFAPTHLSKGSFNQIIDSAPVIFYSCTQNSFYDFIFISKNIETLGFNVDELIGNTDLWLNSVIPEDLGPLKVQMEDCKVKAGCELKYRIKNKLGSQFWIKDKRKFIYNEKSEPTGIIGYWIDISEEERLKAQSQSLFAMIEKTAGVITPTSEPSFIDSIFALSKLNNLLDNLRIQGAVFANTSEAILITDKNGLIQMVNPGFEQISGYQKIEVLGQNPRMLSSGTHNKQFYLALWESILNRGQWQGELTNKRKNGEHYVQFTSINAIKNEKGDVIHFISIATDITGKLKAEEDLRKSNLNLMAATHAKTNFISNISHEIRTPLNSIMGLSEILITSDNSPEHKEYLGRIVKSGQTLLELVNNVLDLSKIESGAIELEIKDFELVALVKEVFGLFEMRAVQKGLEFNVVFSGTQGTVYRGDPMRLRQVLINLVGNSVKFTDKGFCKIEVGPHEFSEDKVIIHLSVIDSGIGIPEDKFAQMFGRFAQLDSSITKQHGGSGLGLSITRELLGLMKGQIKVKSEVNKGSQFEISLPLEIVKKENNKTVNPQLATVFEQTLDILVVDDSEDNRILIGAYLKKMPCRLIYAENGEEAVNLFKAKRLDLVLMDMQMPIMDGYTATENIRAFEVLEHRKRTPVMALTGFALNVEKEKALKAGCDLHMAKPIKRNDLIDAIAKLTHASGNSEKKQAV